MYLSGHDLNQSSWSTHHIRRNGKAYNLIIKTDIAWPYFFPLLVPKFPQTTTPQAEEEHKILENYLMEMRIEDGQLKFPPISELPDGFDLFFQRRSLRKTYEYEDDGDMFTLTVCKDQSKEVNANQTDAYSFNESEAKVLLIMHKQFSTYMHFPDSNPSSPSGAILQEYHFFFVRSQVAQ